MILPEKVGKRKGRGFHTTIVTSFAVEFRAFEEILLPQILASGATNIVLIADERMASLCLSDGSTLPTQLGCDYALHGPPASDGLFHPKIILQIGRDGGRVFVGSANATAAGLVGNAEIAIEISCEAEPSPHQAFVRSVWHYLERTLGDAEGAVRDAVLWARDRAKWITEPVEQVVQALPDGSLLAFFAVPGKPGILERFAEQIADSTVERLIVVSPYWDDDLAALDALRSALKPTAIDVILDTARHDFPREVPTSAGVRILPLGEHFGTRFTHAKLIIAQTAEHDHTLSGSANCTVAALGRIGFRGTNAEACTYRRVDTGAAVEALGLTALLAQAALPATSLPDLIRREPIPLESLAALRPGRFEIDYNVLLWHLPAVPNWSGAKAEILDGDGDLLAEVIPQGDDREPGRHILPCDDEVLKHARFVRLLAGDVRSTPGPISHRAAMRGKRREPVSGRTARSTNAFADALGLDLFLLDAFEDLYAADEPAVDSDLQIAASRGRLERPDREASAPRVLSYAEFMAERPAASGKRGKGDNALAGTHCDDARTLLNRLVGESETQGGSQIDDGWMDTGDEAGLPDDDVRDADVGNDGSDVATPPVDEQRPADPTAFKRAVKVYATMLGNAQRSIGPADVVKLRLLVSIILWQARCAVFKGGLPATTDEEGWPRLALRVLATFFHGKQPPIARLTVNGDFAEMPVDFLECWSTAFWALDAFVEALPAKMRGNAQFLAHAAALRGVIIQRTGLTADDLSSEAMIRVRAALDRTLGARLGFEKRHDP